MRHDSLASSIAGLSALNNGLQRGSGSVAMSSLKRTVVLNKFEQLLTNICSQFTLLFGAVGKEMRFLAWEALATNVAQPLFGRRKLRNSCASNANRACRPIFRIEKQEPADFCVSRLD